MNSYCLNEHLVLSNQIIFCLPEDPRIVNRYAITFHNSDLDLERQSHGKRRFLNKTIFCLLKKKYDIESVVYDGGHIVYSNTNLQKLPHMVLEPWDEVVEGFEEILNMCDGCEVSVELKRMNTLVIKGSSTDNMTIISNEQDQFLLSLIYAAVMNELVYQVNKDNTISEREAIETPEDATLLRRTNFKLRSKICEGYGKFRKSFPIYAIDQYYTYVKKNNYETSSSNYYLRETEHKHFDETEYTKEPTMKFRSDDGYMENLVDVHQKFTLFHKLFTALESYSNVFNKFGIKLRDRRFSARDAEFPILQYGSQVKSFIPPSIPNYPKYIQPADPFSIYTLYGCQLSTAKNCMETLKTMSERRGMTMNLEVFQQYNTQNEDILADLRIAADYKQLHNIDRLLIFVIYDGDNLERVNVELDLFEDCVTQRIVTKTAEDVITNHITWSTVLNEMNMRMDGLNYSIIPHDNIKDIWISNDDVLVVGYNLDISTHSYAEEDFRTENKLQYGTFGYSSNCYENSMKFYGYFHYQDLDYRDKKKAADHILQLRFDHIFRTFHRNRGKLPRIMFIQRKNMMESNYDAFRAEIDTIKCIVDDIYKEFNHDKPKVVVQALTRYHGVRFCDKEGNIYSNTSAGTIIDTQCVRSDMKEFYIQSHTPRSGVTKFTRVQTVINQLGLTIEQLQTYFLALSSIYQMFEYTSASPRPIAISKRMCRAGQGMWDYYQKFHKEMPLREDGTIDFEEMTRIMETKKDVSDQDPPYMKLKHKFNLYSSLHVQKL